MNCFNHSNVIACGICVNCGKAICKECLYHNGNEKILCSKNCLEMSELSDKAIKMTLHKSMQNANISGWSMLSMGVIFLLAGAFLVYREFFVGSAYFLLFGVAGIIGGIAYLRVGKKNA
jgi:hypothetical protein